jgi:hypothetical protein
VRYGTEIFEKTRFGSPLVGIIMLFGSIKFCALCVECGAPVGPEPTEPLSHPTWLVIASTINTSTKYIRRGRGRELATSVVPTLSRSIEASKPPPQPPTPSPGTIDAYTIAGRRLVI